MKKYFEIRMRILKRKENLHEILLLDENGHIAIENDKIEGYMAFDYISGEINGEVATFKINFFDREESFDFSIEEFFIPETFELDLDDYFMELKISKYIKNKYLDIEGSIRIAKQHCEIKNS